MKILILSCNTGEGHNSAGSGGERISGITGTSGGYGRYDASERSADIESSGRSLCGDRETLSVVIRSGLPAGWMGFFG